MNKIIVSTLIVFGLSTAAFAQTPTSFADVDADANGELSLVELQSVWPDMTEAEFGGADVDVSGGLSTDELNGLQAAVPAPAAEPAPASDAPAALEPAQSLADPGPNAEND